MTAKIEWKYVTTAAALLGFLIAQSATIAWWASGVDRDRTYTKEIISELKTKVGQHTTLGSHRNVSVTVARIETRLNAIDAQLVAISRDMRRFNFRSRRRTPPSRRPPN